MSQVQSTDLFTKSLLTLFVDGTTQEKLKHCGHQEAIECINSLILQGNPKLKEHLTPERLLHTSEFLLRNKETICNDKELLCLKSSLDMKSSLISDRVLTGREGDCYQFWNNQWRETYEKLPLPRETDCAVSPLSSSRTYSVSVEQKSWFSTTKILLQNKSCPKTSFPLSKYSVADTTVGVDTPLKKTRVIKMSPNARQKKMLDHFWNGYRYLYNQTVYEFEQMFKDPVFINGDKESKNAYKNGVKHKIVHETIYGVANPFYTQHPWLKKVYKSVRSEAFRNAASAYKSAFTNLRNANILYFKMGYKKKRDFKWTIKFESSCAFKDDRGLVIFQESVGRVATFEDVPFAKEAKALKNPKFGTRFVPDGGCQISKNALGEYFLHVPMDYKKVPDVFDERPGVAMDPGVRKFQTTYDTDGNSYMFGNKEDNDKQWKIIQRMDDINGLLGGKKRGNKRLLREKVRILIDNKHRRDDIHHKVSSFISKNYSCVLIGNLDTKELVKKTPGYSSLRTKTKREMLGEAHGLFRNRLEEKCEAQRTVYMTVHEHYTSRCCGVCGCLCPKSSLETKVCVNCHTVVDRDISGARNILLKHLYIVKAEL